MRVLADRFHRPILAPCNRHRVLVIIFGWLIAACSISPGGSGDASSITVYSGRNEKLIAPVFRHFTQETGIQVRTRYGDTAELAATILEEGRNSPADLFFAQDAGALGALAAEDRLKVLPADILDLVDKRFRSPAGLWIGVTGRARVVAYNSNRVQPEELPETSRGFQDPRWKSRIGWVPTNGSFQAFVTAMRRVEGEATAEQWLRGVQANQPRVFASNLAALHGVAAGEVDVAFINHYYLGQAQRQSEQPLPVRNHFLRMGDPGALINVAGVGILGTTTKHDGALKLIGFLLSPDTQRYFASEILEYPLSRGVPADPSLIPLAEIEPPNLDLGELADLRTTLNLLRKAEVLR